MDKSLVYEPPACLDCVFDAEGPLGTRVYSDGARKCRPMPENWYSSARPVECERRRHISNGIELEYASDRPLHDDNAREYCSCATIMVRDTNEADGRISCRLQSRWDRGVLLRREGSQRQRIQYFAPQIRSRKITFSKSNMMPTAAVKSMDSRRESMSIIDHVRVWLRSHTPFSSPIKRNSRLCIMLPTGQSRLH
jgi:hypothetical protein